ncbi:aromatic-ring-hydroxylating dioxygenase subunit beta [Reyranella sp. CPCC 100927]|uniref:aromatic-ring-hydroxylating dioxygenase subunit beta n=1 Tax=Reyranella sp. CPCC 100927 TaxID=2599616 RepID=UPI0011B6E6C3|nr:aromatic-ring-hydroxylating dioxygenase subunit beta [Reyranella sp. CPCC 100927]TWT15620.1 aromatic-ring-hydroxylating dioxygenase subunit beta [Reyranella sp. CPCC 100927]
MPVPTADDDALLRRVERFIYHEARLQDEHRYAEWEALWTDDGIYWVPANGDDIDPEQQMSIIYDNRSRIGVRIRQLLTGRRYTQEPRSRLRHLITNVEVTDHQAGTIHAACNVMVFESNLRGETIWAARTDYALREADGDLKMASKKVALVNNDKPLHTLSFLI